MDFFIMVMNNNKNILYYGYEILKKKNINLIKSSWIAKPSLEHQSS